MSHRAGSDADVHHDERLGRALGRRLPSPSPDGDGRRSRRDRSTAWPPRLPWRDRLADVAARTGVSPRAVLGLLLLGSLVAAVLAGRLVLAQQRARPVPLRLSATSGAPAASASASTAPATSAATPPSTPSGTLTAAATVLVHVVGQVRHPGVVRLPPGARVQQALEAAGGATPKADLVRVNLARPVVDGEQIVVPAPGQPAEGAPAGPGGAAGAGGSGASRTAPVDLNTAGLDELDSLPGVGPVLAQRILDWRAENGRFTSVDELGEVSGIGDKVLEKLRPLVRV